MKPPKQDMKAFLKAMGRMQEEDYVTTEEFYKMFNAVIEAVKASAVNNKGKIEEIGKTADAKAKELEAYFAELVNAVDARMQEVKDGAAGKDGDTPVAGVDYPDYEEIRSFIADEIEKMPKPDDATSVINVDYIKAELEALEGNDRLSHTAIAGIEQFIDEKMRLMESTWNKGPKFVGGGGSSSGGGTGATTFLGLTDTPSSYTANYYVKVNAAGTALELVAIEGGGDMTAAVYDPTSVAGDAFDMANMVEAANAKILTAAERTILSNTSNTNSGDETTESIRTLGALMDDEITNLADVKAFDPADYATAAQGATADAAPAISSGGGAPSSTPTKVGDIYIDITNDDAYIAVGTASSADWEKSNDGAGGGTGDVSKVGTPVDNQVGVWTGDGTIEGDAGLTFDGGLNVTVADAENKVGLTITQNDATNDPLGLEVNGPSGTGAAKVTSSSLVQFNDATGSNSDWSFNVAGDGWPVINLQSTGGSLGTPTASTANTKSAINTYAYNSTPAQDKISSILTVLTDATAGSEDAYVDIQTSLAGALSTRLRVGNTVNGIEVGVSNATGIVSSRGDQDLTLQTGNATTGNITITDGADGAINLAPNGTGEAQVNGEKIIDETDTASDTVAGIVELATTAETNTGTDATRAVTPDALADSKFGNSALVSSINFVIDGGGSAITTGVKGYIEVPFACTINQVTLLADQSGSIVVDIWKDTYANYAPTDADSITASAPPTISSATKSQDATLTGWTTSISAGDILGFNVDSITTCTRVTLSLKVTRT